MATVEVFVDDAVRGQLPHVCVKTGVPADGKLRIEQERGGIGFAVLLVFLGPIGWIIVAVLLVGAGRRETLTVRLPYSEAAVDREMHIRRLRFRSAVVAGCAVLAQVLLGVSHRSTPGWFGLGEFAVIAVALFAAVQHVRLVRLRVGVDLDASRRWVTLSGVHPDFAGAVEGRYTADAARR